MALSQVTIEDARLVFRNFAGREGQYNREGDRNFGVLLPNDVAQAMAEDGWNVKQLKPREEGDLPQPWLQVSVSYKGRPPRIVLVTSRGRTTISEDLAELVDYADIEKADLILNPYEWVVNGNSGVKAYLKSIYITIREDVLERKYADVPELDLHGRPLAITSGESSDPDFDIVEGELVD